MVLKNPYYSQLNISDKNILLSDMDDTIIDTQGIKKLKAEKIDSIYREEVYMKTYYQTKDENKGNYSPSKQAEILIGIKKIDDYTLEELENILEFSKQDIESNLIQTNIEKLQNLSDHNEIVILTRGEIKTQTNRLDIVFPICNFITYGIITNIPKVEFFQFKNTEDNNELIQKLKSQSEITYYNDKKEENIELNSLYPSLHCINLSDYKPY